MLNQLRLAFRPSHRVVRAEPRCLVCLHITQPSLLWVRTKQQHLIIEQSGARWSEHLCLSSTICTLGGAHAHSSLNVTAVQTALQTQRTTHLKHLLLLVQRPPSLCVQHKQRWMHCADLVSGEKDQRSERGSSKVWQAKDHPEALLPQSNKQAHCTHTHTCASLACDVVHHDRGFIDAGGQV